MTKTPGLRAGLKGAMKGGHARIHGLWKEEEEKEDSYAQEEEKAA